MKNVSLHALRRPHGSFLKSKTLWCLALAQLVSATQIASAGQKTWTGGGSDNNWGTAANWGGVAPVNGDSISFAGSTRVTNINNIAGLTLIGISFNNSGFLFGGNLITNAGGIYDNSGNNTNNLVTYLSASQGITNAVSGTVLQLGGAQTNMASGNILTFGGPGNIYVNGVISGFATVNANGDGAGNGLVRFAAANSFTGPLTINSGTLQIGNASAIPNGAGKGDVTNNATLDLNANSPTINNLYGTGTVDNKAGTGTYTFTVGNNATNQGGQFEFDGVIQNSSGTVALTKVNTNAFYLNGGSDTYAGPTVVSAGQLILGSSATIPNSSTITVSQGAQLNVSAQSSLGIGASQVLNAGRNTNGGPADIIGSVDNSGKLVVLQPSVAGTLTIANNLSLEGGSTINFDLGKTNTAGSGSNDLVAINGTLTLNGGTIALNPFQGTLATGTYGTYTLITNSQTVESGSAANMTVAVPRGITATLNDTTFPGSLLVSITGNGVPVSLVWDGGSGANWDVQQTQDWLNNGSPDYFYFLDNVVFNDVGNGNVNVATGVSPSTTVFNNSSTNAYTLGGPGSISGSGTLSINNGGTVTLNTFNSYTGNTYVNYGQLWLGNYTTGGSPNVTLYNGVTPATMVLGNGGLYIIDQANTFFTETFGLQLNPGGSSLAMRSRQSNSTTYSYQISGNPVRNIGGTLDINNLQTRTGSTVGVYIPAAAAVNGILGGYASLNLNDWVVPGNTGTGSGAYAGYENSNNPVLWGAVSNVVLSANPSAGVNTTTINSLKLTGPSAITINSSQALTLSSGGILVPNNAAGASSFTGGSLLGSPSGDLIVLENSGANALTIASTIADNGGATALTKAGQGTLILTGNNTYSGATYINGATVAGNGSATPGVNAAGTLQVGTGGTAGNLGNSTTVTNFGTLAFDRSDNVTLGIRLNGPGALKQIGSGTLTLTGANTYSGNTTVSAGTLQVGNGGTVGSLGSSSNLVDNGSVIFSHSDNVSFAGAISGSGTLVNQGAGNLTLGSADTYSGATIINGGNVILGANASISNSAAIVLASGTTFDASAAGGLVLNAGTVNQILAGTGTIIGNVTTAAGVGQGTRITPGTNGVYGTLTFNNNLTLNGGTINFDISSSSKDLVTVGGNLTLTGGTIQLNVSGSLANGSYKLIGYSGGLGGAVGNLIVSGFSQPGQVASLSSATANEIDLVISTYVPKNLTWQGDGSANAWDMGITSDWTNSTGASVTFGAFDNGTLDDSSPNTTVNLTGTVSATHVSINGTVNSYTLQGSGSLGAGDLTINNPNTTAILAENSYSGPTVINAGTVAMGNGSAEGTFGSGVVTNNSILTFNEPSNTIIGNVIAGSGGLFQSAGNTLALLGNNTMTGPVTVSSGALDIGGGTGSGTLGSGLVTNNGTLLIDRVGALTLNNNITGSGAIAFVGSGTVTYGGNNTYANNTYISNGIVKLGSSTAIPAPGGAGDWLILDGSTSTAGTLDLNGINGFVNALQGLNGAASGAVGGAVNGTIYNSASGVTNTLTIVGTDNQTYSGTIADNPGSGGKVALVVLGGGNQSLDIESAAGNTFSGGTTISNSTVTLRSSYSGSTANYPNPVGLGTGPVTLLTNGTIYCVGGFGQNIGPTWTSLGNTINIPAGQNGTIYGPQRGSMSGNITGAGTLTYVTAYVRGAVSGNWSAFTGQINFENSANGGQLGIANTSGFGRVFCTNSAATAAGVTLYNTVAGTPTIPIGELHDDGTAFIESTSSGNAGGAAANFAVGGLNTSVTFGGGIIDNVGIIKVGTGSWTLTNATSLTYSGQTVVSNGVLVLGPLSTLTQSTPITLAAPGKLDVSAAGTLNLGSSVAQTLQGNGTLNGSLNVAASGTVSPGGANAIATLTVTNAVTLGGTIVMELNNTNTPGSNDMLVATSITAGGTLQVNNLGPDLHTGDTFKLFSVPVTGTFAVTNLPLTTGNGSITYVWTNKLAVDGTIAVLVGAPLINTNPTNITASVSGNTLSLSWPADHLGWYLQVQTNTLGSGLSGNWVDVPGSSGVTSESFTINPANPSVFYRMSLNP